MVTMVGVEEPAAEAAPTPTPVEAPGRGDWWWVPGAITVITIASVIVVTLSQLHPHLLLSDTTTTGGDTGAHIAMPKYLENFIRHGHLTGWDPGWFDGFPLYTFYFTLPDFFIAVGGWVIPYDVAFKLGTVLGSVLLPVTAWACGRLFRLRAPIPTLLAAATLPFLFDYTFTIYGGNLFSTLAGEYSFSFSLALAVLFLGLFACAVREGRYRGWAAAVLAGCVLSHIVPAFYALGAALVLTVMELLPARWGITDARLRLWRSDPAAVDVSRRRTLWWAGSTVGIGLLLSGFWLVPFGLEHAYTTTMGYTNLDNYLSLFFPEADAWALVIAGLGFFLAVCVRSRFGLTLSVLGIASAIALVVDPQGDLYNVRLLPLWFISVYFMAAWAFGTICILVAQSWRKMRLHRWELSQVPASSSGVSPADSPDPAVVEAVGMSETSGPPEPADEIDDLLTPRRRPSPRWGPAAVSGAVLGLLLVMTVVVPPFIVPASSLPVTVGANEITNWSNFNYVGYEGTAAYPEYRSVIKTMESVAKKHGCGRAMWEYSSSENRFGTPESLMLLPYWTSGCIDSMEGLLFESSTTTPYHWINQSELSAGPSDPEVGLPYGPLNVALGVKHLQLLGVKYFMAETPAVEAQADADPSLELLAETGPWASTDAGAAVRTTWKIYLVRNAPLVVPLRNQPVVLSGVKPGPSSWLGHSSSSQQPIHGPSIDWYDDPSRWSVELAQSGPSSWSRVALTDTHPPATRVPTTRVSAVTQTDSSVRFHVSRLGTPVLVKMSYFPNWQASGADGPYRVTPNLMVVVPTSHEVTLSYGSSSADYLGLFCSLLGLAALVVLYVVPTIRRRRTGTP